jgi:hypothetical protein
MKTDQPSTELATVGSGSEPSLGHMLQAFIEKGVTEQNVAAFERLVALHERGQAKQAEREFAAAFVALQSDMPQIDAVKPVPNRDGSIRYKFAPYEEIMDKAKPVLQKHGFTVSFSMSYADGRITQNCILQHVGGHTRTNQFMARIGSGPPNSSEAQGDGAAATYAKRQALCDALNIVVSHMDNDGADDLRNEGAPITQDRIIYLKELVKETNSDEAAFLRFAGADSYEKIGSGKYDVLVRALLKKKQA